MSIPSTSYGVLEPEELAYLLATVDASSVAGFEFGLDDDADLSRGLEKLKEHGWLRAGETGWNMHWALPLLASILSTPERAITLTRHFDVEGRYDTTIGFFEAGGITAEISPAEGGYGFAIRDESSILYNRAASFSESIGGSSLDPSFASVRAEELEAALTEPVVGEKRKGLESLLSPLMSGGAAEQLANSIAGGTKIATVEAAGFIGALPLLRKDLYCLGEPTAIVAGERRPGTKVVITPFSTSRFAQLVELMWSTVDIDRQQLQAVAPKN